MDLVRLQHVAGEFRKAIEDCDVALLPIGLENFPRGCCGDTVLLLGAHLKDLEFGDFDHVCGERGYGADWTSHAWLEQDGVIVDITADQFADMPDKVVVSRHSPWHSGWTFEQRDPGDFRLYAKPKLTSGIAALYKAYPVVLSQLA